jgi:hypothetical protein
MTTCDDYEPQFLVLRDRILSASSIWCLSMKNKERSQREANWQLENA